MTTVYTCKNEDCTLGVAGAPGRFTGGTEGIAAWDLRKTENDDAPHGEGVCPNCGVPGDAASGSQVSAPAEDPYDDLHKKTFVAVYLGEVEKDDAQAYFQSLVEERDNG